MLNWTEGTPIGSLVGDFFSNKVAIFFLNKTFEFSNLECTMFSPINSPFVILSTVSLWTEEADLLHVAIDWAAYAWPLVSVTDWTAAIVCGEVAPLSPSSAVSHALSQSAGELEILQLGTLCTYIHSNYALTGRKLGKGMEIYVCRLTVISTFKIITLKIHRQHSTAVDRVEYRRCLSFLNRDRLSISVPLTFIFQKVSIHHSQSWCNYLFSI